MTGCEQFPEGSRKRHICDGVGGLPLAKVNAYRASWNIPELAELPEQQLSAPIIHTNAQRPPMIAKALSVPCPTCTKPKPITEGPGTELKKILQAKGVPPCQSCDDTAQRMNEMGPDECEAQIWGIVAEMLPRAIRWIKANKPWLHALLPNVVESAGASIVLHGYVKQAIENYRSAGGVNQTLLPGSSITPGT
jgi:hypothetical protein